MRVAVRQANDFEGIEERVNETLKRLEDENKEIIDIKYSASTRSGTSVNFTSMIIYK